MLSLQQVVSKYQDEQEQAALLHHDRDLVSSRERLVLSEQSGFQRYLCAASTGNAPRNLARHATRALPLWLPAHPTRHPCHTMRVREAQGKCSRGRRSESLPSQASR